MNDTNSLAHTKWNCKYHIVFAPKYRRKVFFGEKRREIGKILRQLCEWKKVNIVEAEVCPDHIHMLLEIPPKIAVSSFVGYLKGKSSLPQSQVVNSQKASGIKEIHLLYRLPSCFVLILFTVLPLIWDKKKQETFSDFPLSKTVKFF